MLYLIIIGNFPFLKKKEEEERKKEKEKEFGKYSINT